VGAYLLASAHRAGLPLWTRDRRLERAAGAVLIPILHDQHRVAETGT
jgi:predicted nucleic acid-binding protein